MVGVGPGSGDYLTPAAKEAVLAAEVLVGGRKAMALCSVPGKEQRLIGSDLEGALAYIDEARQSKRVAVLLSGDPGFYSLLPRLSQRLGSGGIRVIPGISSLQLACARLGIKWEGLAVVSVHGRGLDSLAEIAGAKRAAVLTSPKNPPGAVCRRLLELGSRFGQAWVLTDLGLAGERIAHGSLETIAGQQRGSGNSILILLQEEPEPGWLPADRLSFGASPGGTGEAIGGEGAAGAGEDPSAYLDVVTPGLPDKLFRRGAAAMSQEEVRALALCKARLKRGMVVYEIGAGTGSWTVEAARLVAPGTVWAVEKNPAAAALVRANLLKFGITNVRLVEGDAPDACCGWPPADCLLIGGSGGRLREILGLAGGWLSPGGRVVISAVTPDSFSGAWQALQDGRWDDQDTVMISLARVASRGGAQIWSGENPVFILSARLGCESGGRPGDA